jgi:hypothetical protein
VFYRDKLDSFGEQAEEAITEELKGRGESVKDIHIMTHDTGRLGQPVAAVMRPRGGQDVNLLFLREERAILALKVRQAMAILYEMASARV